MAICLQSHVVSDLCLGKPALKSISLSSSVGDALVALKASEDSFISVWTCDHTSAAVDGFSAPAAAGEEKEGECRCVGKICMVDILCFLCRDDNSDSPVSALNSPLSVIVPKSSALVKHVEPSTSLVEAIGLILQGAHNLVVPIQTTSAAYSKTEPSSHGGRDYCWLTQEDLIRFLLSRIGLFTPILAYSIDDLGIIQKDIPTMDYHSPAALALDHLAYTAATETSVAVIDEIDGTLVGEISPSALVGADEATAAAIMALSCGDLMAYIDSWGGPPEDLIGAVKARLKDSGFEGLLALFDDDHSSTLSSDDDEDSTSLSSSSSPVSPFGRSRRYNRSGSYSFRMGPRTDEITCHPGSSLVAVMIQAIAHRVNYAWVVDENCSLAGMVTFTDMLEVFYEHMKPVAEEEY